MAEYLSETIKDMVENIEQGRVVLPAMQRNFVWPEDKIYKLFESLMRDYPIGTFLFWIVDDSTFRKYIFNEFIKDYDEQKGKMQRGDKATRIFSDYTAVLDGQQRITSLYIGVKGKYRTHIKGKKWDDDSSYYDRFLCINVLFEPNEDEAYQFQFRKEEDIECFRKNEAGDDEYWLKVSRVFDGEDTSDIADEIEEKDKSIMTPERRRTARKMLSCLQNALTEKKNVSYFPAKNKCLSDVVDIFVRVNSGGQKLESSDLMLSVAAGQQGETDVHVLIQGAVDEINAVPSKVEEGFRVDKELILTAGLMLTGAESLSLKKDENWSATRMNDIFKDHWESIIEALKNTVSYIEYLGFIGRKLTSKNLVLPIAYYFYHNNLGDNHKNGSSNRASCDRIFIRQWLIRAMINNIFKDGTRGTLLAIRNLIEKTDKNHFPLEDLIEKAGKRSLTINDEQILDILALKYGDSRIVPIFSELAHSSCRSTDQVDHIWPKSVLLSKKKVKKAYPMITDDELASFKEKCNGLANLQILDQVENNQKDDSLFYDWVTNRYTDVSELNNYKKMHFIPDSVSLEFRDFLRFYKAREELLLIKLKEAFPSDFIKLVNRYNLSDKIS